MSWILPNHNVLAPRHRSSPGLGDVIDQLVGHVNQVNERLAQVQAAQAIAGMSSVSAQSSEHGAGAPYIPAYGVVSGGDHIFHPRWGGGLPLHYCTPWSAEESDVCNRVTTGRLSNAGGREPPRMNTFFGVATSAGYPIDGERRLVRAAAEVSPDTTPRPGFPLKGKENITKPRGVKPKLHNKRNNRKGNSGGFNGFSLFRSHQRYRMITEDDLCLADYITRLQDTSDSEGAARNNASINKVGKLAQKLKNKGQRGANAYFSDVWKVLPDEEKDLYNQRAYAIRSAKRADKTKVEKPVES